MRVLALITDAFGGHGGIAKFNRDLLQALCAYPTCLEVVAIPRLMPSFPSCLPEQLTYVTSGLNSKLNHIMAVLRATRRNSEFDLIICGHVNLLPIAFLLRLWTRAPIALVVHGIDAWEPADKKLIKYLVRRLDACISVSELTSQRFLRWTKLDVDKGFLLPNSIDLEHFSPGTKNAALLNRYGLADKTVLMTFGRLVSYERYKGFDEVLDLLPILVEEDPSIVYLIAGDGEDRQRLEEKVSSLNMDEHVMFTGFVPEAEKADHYRLADVYVMPSRGEGFGIVYLEAMACGIPVVASKVDGSREAVRNGELGILIDPADPEDIMSGIFEALDHPRGVVPDGLSYFSYGSFEKRCHSTIERVLNGHSGAKGECLGRRIRAGLLALDVADPWLFMRALCERIKHVR